MQWKSAERLAILALLGGATGIGFAPILVRLSEVGPSATAFYRLLFALPFLWLAVGLQPDAAGVMAKRTHGPASHEPRLDRSLWLCALAGFLFAGDLAFWHWSIKLTSVANSTLLTNFAPFFVVIGARLLFREPVTRWLVVGMSVASVGAAMLVGGNFQISARHLLGDVLALITAGFYGGYLLTIKYLRVSLPTAHILAWSGLVSCGLLLIIALVSREEIWITSAKGWAILLCLGLVSHVGGQGLIAYALAHLPAGFSSVGLLLQPVVAAALAWLILTEGLSLLQAVGGLVVLLGIAVASLSRKAPPKTAPVCI